ncbi:hypothetical protein FHU38_003095 [Saccharomonospora amisosensis]|uniref:DUF742 domain-containing protein n=1 Tax=Saccharomonospora amisosensis TaxID=1128677 RepID=A0A7X5URC3_9PSEU|nr:DUF742 domain-containing protein [Saccharomonospora amisosensis]NIJ12751.1 hypothetical protein [Saccharomonospora amisosensis]
MGEGSRLPGEEHLSELGELLGGFGPGAGRDVSGRAGGRQHPGARRAAASRDPRHGVETKVEEQLVSAEAIPLHAAEQTGFVRPYAITGGRTKSNHDLELETLVSTRQAALLAVPDQIEHQLIMEECRTPHSVAEIAAMLRVPFGVARVLVSDAADAGLVNVHRTISGDEGAEAHLLLMERVLSGLRRL